MFNWIVMWFLIIITLVAVFINNIGILVILCIMLMVGVVCLVKINAKKEKPFYLNKLIKSVLYKPFHM